MAIFLRSASAMTAVVASVQAAVDLAFGSLVHVAVHMMICVLALCLYYSTRR